LNFQLKFLKKITHRKKLDINKDAIADFIEFLDKISPLNNSGKLGAILIQLPPSFSIEYFNTLEKFLENIPIKLKENESDVTNKQVNNDYQYAIESRQPS
jgi:uncharacterized protein YecE (DUF72 family)